MHIQHSPPGSKYNNGMGPCRDRRATAHGEPAEQAGKARPPARGRQQKRVRRHHGPGGGRARRYGHRNHGTTRRTAKVTRCEGGRRTDAGEGAKASRKQAQQKGNDLPSCTPPADTDSILHASFPLFPRKNKSGPCPDSRLGAAFFHFRLSEKCLYIHSLAGCMRHFDRSCVASCAAPYSSGGSAPFFVALFIPLCPLLRFTHGRVRQCAVPVVDQGRGQLYHTRAF